MTDLSDSGDVATDVGFSSWTMKMFGICFEVL